MAPADCKVDQRLRDQPPHVRPLGLRPIPCKLDRRRGGKTPHASLPQKRKLAESILLLPPPPSPAPDSCPPSPTGSVSDEEEEPRQPASPPATPLPLEECIFIEQCEEQHETQDDQEELQAAYDSEDGEEEEEEQPDALDLPVPQDDELRIELSRDDWLFAPRWQHPRVPCMPMSYGLESAEFSFDPMRLCFLEAEGSRLLFVKPEA